MHALKPLGAVRVAARATALDAARWPDNLIVLRIAADEAIVLPRLRRAERNNDRIGSFLVDDEHAITAIDTSLCGVWIPIDDALDILQRECEWELPTLRPTFAQGAVAGLPVKLWFEHDRVLFIVAAPFATDFAERIR